MIFDKSPWITGTDKKKTLKDDWKTVCRDFETVMKQVGMIKDEKKTKIR